ncbi:hypothetical protein BO94DRAFT_625788 [Aspergillus sclerotioniger CBS 115572]|uniref:Uncharacterized protein n=1 Tax=Aspergillus sclerotioniger CBS 115572 TaxID=1450535 RepID=A0A317W5M0_9EURO|nr:hypothetical protein BO94DRAFT_625788 [Aspergillus sclerotioniger CBS 115572]PWY81643.1 hypothetical protein BO94DRAFT_625788 [Aspergillus sclerotioniger CBS 115572]
MLSIPKLSLSLLTILTTILPPTTAYFYTYPALFIYKDYNCSQISWSLVYPTLGACNYGYWDYAGSFQMFNIDDSYSCDAGLTLSFEVYNSSGTNCGDESDLLFRQPVTEDCTAAEVESPGPLEMPIWFRLGCM